MVSRKSVSGTELFAVNLVLLYFAFDEGMLLCHLTSRGRQVGAQSYSMLLSNFMLLEIKLNA